jgi:hypothetical protein
MDAFLKMIDDLQTPKHKTNHIYRSCFPLKYFKYQNNSHLYMINNQYDAKFVKY